MSHLWKIDLYKVLMFPGCFREDLVAGGRHSSWGTKYHKILSQDPFQNMPVFQKTQRIRKKKLQKSTKSQQKKQKIQPSKFSQPTPNLRARFAPGSAPPLFLHPLARHRLGRRTVAGLLKVIGGEVEGNEGGPGVLVLLGGLEIGILEAFWRSRFPIFVRNVPFLFRKWWCC